MEVRCHPPSGRMMEYGGGGVWYELPTTGVEWARATPPK